MPKLLLLSTVLISIWLPIVCAQNKSPRRGMRQLWGALLLYNVFYAFAVLEIYPRLNH